VDLLTDVVTLGLPYQQQAKLALPDLTRAPQVSVVRDLRAAHAAILV
jgi:hypothetical protein